MKYFIFIFLLYSAGALGQATNRENYDLKHPGKDFDKKCADLIGAMRSAPMDVRFGTEIQGDSIFLMHSDPAWFNQFIIGKGDGIAIDLVYADQFSACDNIHRMNNSWSHQGFLLPPLYREDIKSRLIPNRSDFVKIYAGSIPKNFKKENLEANYLIIKDKYLCHYSNVINLDYHGWELLENGLYYDTLNRNLLEEKYQELSKVLHFTIPFEKEKWQYKEEDIRPLYDSLRLTDYTIKSIKIVAYTSVEGTYERNQKLQSQRAETIVKALQSFQPEKLEYNITANENWVEFLDDVTATPYRDLTVLTKDEIKERLKSPELLVKLEPVLKKHRKAIVELELEKRLSYFKSTPDELKKYFDQQIADKNINEALYLQQIIFYKIGHHETPETFLRELEVPEALAFGSLLINRESFNYEYLQEDVLESIRAFEKLDVLLKSNPRIKYNLCALKLEAWRLSRAVIEPVSLKRDIDALKKMGIPEILVRRLAINFAILQSEEFMKQKNYAAKDNNLEFIYNSYKPLKLNDDDLLNLAKYFSFYSQFNLATAVLDPRTRALDVSEDLLFYYINLTIYYEKNTKSNTYRAIMLNAINENKVRFCELFNSIQKGGITFQLLADPYLKKTYCENCK